MVHISASLLAADFARMGEDVHRAEAAGVDSFHVDVMDGYYVPNIALAPYHLRALRTHTHLPFILHLEVRDPVKILKSFEGIPAEMVIVQIDTLPNPPEMFDLIRQRGSKIGLGVNPGDSVETIRKYVRDVDLLLVMAVEPGFGNQKHNPLTPVRAAKVTEMLKTEKREIPIGSDGGINLENLRLLLAAGVSHLIVGTALFQATDMVKTVAEIRSLAVG